MIFEVFDVGNFARFLLLFFRGILEKSLNRFRTAMNDTSVLSTCGALLAFGSSAH